MASSDKGICFLDRDFHYVSFNDTYALMKNELYNSGQVTVGRSVFDYITNEEDKLIARMNFQTVLAGKETVNYQEFGNENYSRKVLEVKTFPIRDSRSSIVGIMILINDVTKMEKDKAGLEKLTERLEIAEECGKMGTWEMDVLAKRNWWSKNLFRLFYLPIGEEAPEPEVYDSHIHPEDRDTLNRSVDLMAKGIVPPSFVFRTNPEKGPMRYLYPTYSIIRDEMDNIVKFIGTSNDITELKIIEMKVSELLEEKEILLREVHHRINNNMSVLLSILSLQTMHVSDMKLKSILTDIQSRIQSMNVLYNKLYRSENLRAMSAREYFTNLIEDIKDIFKIDESVCFDLDITDNNLSVKALFSLGLIANELITNSLKYAFLDMEGTGNIKIVMYEDKEVYHFIIKDNGRWRDATPKSGSGFGLELVELMAKQLGAEWNMHRSTGTEYEFRFRLNSES